MKKLKLVIFLFIAFMASESLMAQYSPYNQNRRRSMVQNRSIRPNKPQPKDVEKELARIMPICIETFSFDEFEKQIFRQFLTKKIEAENRILVDEDMSIEAKIKQFNQIRTNHLSEINVVMTPDEVEQYKLLDFSKEDRNRKKKEKRKKRKKDKSKE